MMTEAEREYKRQNVLPALKETVQMAWPAVLESFFVALAGMIDTMMVATLGSSAVAAIGLTNQPKFIGLAFFFAANIATSALVARRRGEQRKEAANQTLLTSLSYTLLMCAVVSALCIVGAPLIMRLCGSSADTHDMAVTYFRIIMGGMLFNVVSLAINAAQRGSGNTRIAMRTNITSSIVNVCFNYLLIGGHFGFPALGITGAALATVLGTVVACVMSIVSLFHKESFVSLPFSVKNRLLPTWEAFRDIIKLGVNFFVENLAMRVGFMATALMAAGLGTEAFAAHQVGMNFLGLGFAFGDGMQVSAVALIGRSLGEKRPDKAKRYGSLCQKIGLVISCCLAAVFFFGGEFLYGLYFAEPHIVQMGVLISRFTMFVVLFQISQVVYGGCLRGAGDVKFTLMVSLISVTFIRTAVTWVCVELLSMGLAGIWLGILADQLSRILMLSARFYQGKWVNIKI